MTKELSNLHQRISESSDDELLKMLNVEYADYRREALEFATEELIRRGFELNKVGPDFNVVTPDGIKLRPPTSPAEKKTGLASSFAVGPGGIATWVYLVAALAGVIVPLIVALILALPFVLVFQSSLQSQPESLVSDSSLSIFLLLGLLILVAIILTYTGLGTIFGYRWPEQNWRWGLWLTVPGITLSFASRELFKSENPLAATIGFAIGSILIVVLPTCLGARWGAGKKEKKKANQAVQGGRCLTHRMHRSRKLRGTVMRGVGRLRSVNPLQRAEHFQSDDGGERLGTRAHTVPRFYLGGFVAPESDGDHDPFVWVGSLRTGEVTRRSPKHISIARGLYDGPGGLSGADASIEDHLAGIESAASSAI